MKSKNGFIGLRAYQAVAIEVGIQEAIVFHNIYFWCALNERRARRTHFHDGTYWVYFSARELAEFFGFWSEPQIRRMLKKLVGCGYLKAGCFNKKGYDKTKWYTPLRMIEVPTDEIDEPLEEIDTPF